MRSCVLILLLAGALPPAALGQQHPTVREALRAYQALEFGRAIGAARSALRARLSREDRITTYEVLAFSHGALDSTRQAVEAFRELIFLDPNREPDVQRVSPRITSLYASALGQVLVVRRVRADSASFIAGRGSVPIRFEVSRPSRVITRVIGQGIDATIDSQLVAGSGAVRWEGLTRSADPVPPGPYQIVVTAVEGRNEFGTRLPVTVLHGGVDTLAHLTSLPGYTEQPEYEVPPRNWRPLGITVLYAGLVSGAALALENTGLDVGSRREVAGVGALALLSGFVMSVRRPDPRPVQANILYNQLLREQLAQRNAEIARENTERRRQVMLTVVPAVGGGS